MAERYKTLRKPQSSPSMAFCCACSHWIPDSINPPGGLRLCGKNVPGLAWPWRELEYSSFTILQN